VLEASRFVLKYPFALRPLTLVTKMPRHSRGEAHTIFVHLILWIWDQSHYAIREFMIPLHNKLVSTQGDRFKELT
jgi:hypothetical protein